MLRILCYDKSWRLDRIEYSATSLSNINNDFVRFTYIYDWTFLKYLYSNLLVLVWIFIDINVCILTLGLNIQHIRRTCGYSQGIKETFQLCYVIVNQVGCIFVALAGSRGQLQNQVC